MNKSTRAKSKEIKTVVRRQLANIYRWRRLGITWKGIRQHLGLSCMPRTLADHVNGRGLI